MDAMNSTDAQKTRAAIAAVLRGIKAEYRIGDAEIARESGLGREAISKYVNAHRDAPIVVILAVAKLTGQMTAADIMDRVTARLAADESAE